jgi:hypothetical protein
VRLKKEWERVNEYDLSHCESFVYMLLNNAVSGVEVMELNEI